MRLAFVLALLLSCSLVSALGISQPYTENNTVYVEQGEYYEHKINIQNSLPIELPIEIGVTGDYITVGNSKKTIVVVPASSTDFHVPLAIAVPDEAPAGLSISASYYVQVVDDDGGTVPMTPRLSDNFKLVITEKPGVKERATSGIGPYVLAGLLALVLIVTSIVLVRRRHKRKIVRDAKTPGSLKSVKNVADLVAYVAELSDAEVRAGLKSGELAKALHRFNNDPEAYHAVRSAKNRSQLIRALRNAQ